MLAGKLMTAVFTMVILCLSITGFWALRVRPIIVDGLLESQLAPLFGAWNEDDTPAELRVVRIVLDDLYAFDLLDLPRPPARGEWFKRVLRSLFKGGGALEESPLVERLRREPGTIGMSLDGYRHHGRKEAIAELRRAIQKAKASGGRVQIVVQGYLTDTVMQAISGEDKPRIDRILVLGVNDWAYARVAKGNPKEFTRPENVGEAALMWLRKETIPRSFPIQLYDAGNKGLVLHGRNIFPNLDLNTFHGRQYATYDESLKAVSDMLYTMTDPAYPLAKILGHEPEKPTTIELPAEVDLSALPGGGSAEKKPPVTAEKPKEEQDPKKIDYSSPLDPASPISIKAPKGWAYLYDGDKSNFGRMEKGRVYAWSKTIYINKTPQNAAKRPPGESGPWAHIEAEYESFSRLNNDPSRAGALAGCPAIKIRNVTDYAMELNCGSEQSCRPCKDRKCPRGPLFNTCGDFLSELELPIGKGFLFRLEPYREGAPGHMSDEFSKSLDRLLLLYDIPGSPGIHTISLTTPREYYERYSPALQGVVESYRLHPKKK